DEALALSSFKAGERLVAYERWTVDSRLPAEEQRPLTPTPKQLLYGMRQTLAEIETERDASGRIQRAWACLSPAASGASDDPPGFLFRGHDLSFVPGETYTLDADPNDFYGFWGAKVVRGLLAGGRNALFDLLAAGGSGNVAWPTEALAGQVRFMAGLQAMHAA